MPIIQKPEQTTLGHVFNLKELSKKIYTEEEIKSFRLDESINNHPLARKPTAIRSKLAYKEILRNLRPDKKYILPGQVVLFNYSQPKFKEELEYYDNYPFCISFGIIRTNEGVIRECMLNLHYYPPFTRAKIMELVFTHFRPYFEKYFNEASSKPNTIMSYSMLKHLLKTNQKIAFGTKMYIPVLRGITYNIPARLLPTAFYTEGKFSKATLQQIWHFWRQF